MTALAAALVGLAVFLLIRPDPALRLESIAGAGSPRMRAHSIRVGIERVIGGRRRRGAERSAAIEALGALAAELGAGTPPQQALIATGSTIWSEACGAVRFDGDVAEALRRDAERIPLLAPLSACWAVSTQQGSGLLISVTRLAEQARVAEDIRVQLEAQLAGPRATARILMLLPLFGIAMGMMMGVNPLGWLLGTLPGLLCLLSGVGLTALGYWWTSRIVKRVEILL